MYEKILQKLKTQRATNSNVSDRSLEDMAKSYEPIIKDDESLNTLDFTKIIQSLDGNISKIAADAAKKAKDEADVQKKQTTDPDPDDISKKRKKTDKDDIPEWATALLQEVQSLKTEKTVNKRQILLETKLKEYPDAYKKVVLQSFQKTNFKDDEEFNQYLTEMETAGTEFTQSLKENGLLKTVPSDPKHIEDTGETTQLAAARTLVKKQQKTT